MPRQTEGKTYRMDALLPHKSPGALVPLVLALSMIAATSFEATAQSGAAPSTPEAAQPAPLTKSETDKVARKALAAAAENDPTASAVEVSLGDWAVKNALARALQVKVSEVPLTVSVAPEIASAVCPLSHDDLEQQKVTSATRTCAAKRVSDELREAVRQQVKGGR